MKDHFGYIINVGDYILHARADSSSVWFNAGKVLDVDNKNGILICKNVWEC